MKNLKILHIPDTCTGCGACASVCPRECIEMKADQDGFYFPVIDMEKCVECHACENGCHIISPSEAIPISKDNFYVYWTNDEILRQQSTSGGAFSLFAQYVIDQGGAVFASRYNGEMERLEVCNSDICGLEPQRKSKYIETYVGRAFAEIRDELKKGRWVLYCGTPCQAAGLRQHIKQMKTPSEKLIIIDFACHGVPSNGFFTKFKRKFETKTRKLVDAEFRVKDPADPQTGWHIQTLRLTFCDGKRRIFRRNSYYYYYYWPFDVSVSLRRSCYDCHQVDFSEADITIGDFWDIKDYPSLKDDNKGFSYIKINNKTLLPLFNQLTADNHVEHLSNNIVRRPYKKRSKIHLVSSRERFLSYTREYEYFKAVRKYFGWGFILKNTIFSQIKDSIRPVFKSRIWKKRE